MSEQHITNYTKDEISNILGLIQSLVANDKFILSQNTNRRENNEFIIQYNLTISKVKNIITEIGVNDFCYGLHNEHVGFVHEILYVFCPQIELYIGEDKEAVDVYTKFNIIDGEKVVVISFHKRNFPITYLFKTVN